MLENQVYDPTSGQWITKMEARRRNIPSNVAERFGAYDASERQLREQRLRGEQAPGPTGVLESPSQYRVAAAIGMTESAAARSLSPEHARLESWGYKHENKALLETVRVYLITMESADCIKNFKTLLLPFLRKERLGCDDKYLCGEITKALEHNQRFPSKKTGLSTSIDDITRMAADVSRLWLLQCARITR